MHTAADVYTLYTFTVKMICTHCTLVLYSFCVNNVHLFCTANKYTLYSVCVHTVHWMCTHCRNIVADCTNKLLSRIEGILLNTFKKINLLDVLMALEFCSLLDNII